MKKKLKLPFGLRMAKMGWEKSTCNIKMGSALIIKSNVVVAWNSIKGSPGAARWYDYPAEGTHAEFRLFNNYLLDNLPIKGTVYVYRQLADQSLGLAKPCDSCIKFLQTCGIYAIVYTTYQGYTKEWLNNGRERTIFIKSKED